MKKRLLCLVLLISLLLSLAGCALGGGKRFAAESLEVWIWDEGEAELWQSVADTWSEQTEVPVRVKVQTETEYWQSVLSGDLPDLLWVDSAHLPACLEGRALLALDSLLEEGELSLERCYAPLLSLFRSGGATWAVPKDSRVTALWYSRALFDSRGLDYPDETWTWQDVCQAAAALTDRASGLYGFAMNQTDTANGWYNIVCSAGGAVLRTGEDGAVTPAWTEEETRAAMELVGSLAATAMPSQPTMTQQGTMELFTAGRVAMVLLDSEQALALLSMTGASQFDCTLLPYWDRDGSGDCGEGERTAVLDGTGWAISSSCGDPAAAFDLLSAFAGQGGQEAQVRAGAALPALSGLEEAWVETVWSGVLSPYRVQLESGALAELPVQAAGETWLDYAMSTTLYTAWNNPDAMGEMLALQQEYTLADLSAADSAAEPEASGETAGTETDGAAETDSGTETDGAAERAGGQETA